MGLTKDSSGSILASDKKISLEKLKRSPEDKIIAFAGNPNVGKSTIFNQITGMKQHTGNWTGKTVSTAAGHAKKFPIVAADLPGTYSLRANSPEEVAARDFISGGFADCTVVVCDALCLERNLILALQIIELTPKTVICVNLLDEAERKGISVDLELLEKQLGVPVVGTAAGRNIGIDELCEKAFDVAVSCHNISDGLKIYPEEVENEIKKLQSLQISRGEAAAAFCDCRSERDEIQASIDSLLKIYTSDELSEIMKKRTVIAAEGIAAEAVTRKSISSGGYSDFDRRIDKIITHPIWGSLITLAMLAGVFWLTIVGSNYPSELLGFVFGKLESYIYGLSFWSIFPDFVREAIVSGMIRTLFRVVSVMLPPMAIFFPIFTLMEDVGLLGRLAFNFDGAFASCKSCGKQALTMSMGLGCNAAGVVGCRIIDSPRERLIAILTNNFMPCNGRFPILITISAIIAASGGALAGAGIMTGAVLSGCAATLVFSWLLSSTLLKGEASSFALELPPYRKPQIGKVIIRSVFDRTLYVLFRAAIVAAPAGLVIWMLSNIQIDEKSLIIIASEFLDPFGRLIGIDGVMVCSLILGFPANEIVLPIASMIYTSESSMGSGTGIADILALAGWKPISYVNLMILTIFRFPCSTTLITIYRETKSLYYSLLSFLLPTSGGILLCLITTAVYNVFCA